MSHRGDRSGSKREVDIKPQRVDIGVVRTYSAQNMRRAPAGDVTANGHRGRMRGSGEACRYHSVHVATVEDGAQPSGGGLRRAGNHHAVGQAPLSPDKVRDDIRKELEDHFQSETGRSFARLEENASGTAAGWERPATAPLSTASRTNEVMRYIRPQTPRNAPVPQQTSNKAKAACRFHMERKARSVTPDGGDGRRLRNLMQGRAVWDSDGGGPEITKIGSWRPAQDEKPGPCGTHSAGVTSGSRFRYDTPGGLNYGLGRTRSLTPDYHRRYSHNTAGASLPGTENLLAPQSARVSRKGRGHCDPLTTRLTPDRHAMSACRYHQDAADLTVVRKRQSVDARKSQALDVKDCTPRSEPRPSGLGGRGRSYSGIATSEVSSMEPSDAVAVTIWKGRSNADAGGKAGDSGRSVTGFGSSADADSVMSLALRRRNNGGRGAPLSLGVSGGESLQELAPC